MRSSAERWKQFLRCLVTMLELQRMKSSRWNLSLIGKFEQLLKVQGWQWVWVLALGPKFLKVEPLVFFPLVNKILLQRYWDTFCSTFFHSVHLTWWEAGLYFSFVLVKNYWKVWKKKTKQTKNKNKQTKKGTKVFCRLKSSSRFCPSSLELKRQKHSNRLGKHTPAQNELCFEEVRHLAAECLWLRFSVRCTVKQLKDRSNLQLVLPGIGWTWEGWWLHCNHWSCVIWSDCVSFAIIKFSRELHSYEWNVSENSFIKGLVATSRWTRPNSNCVDTNINSES